MNSNRTRLVSDRGVARRSRADARFAPRALRSKTMRTKLGGVLSSSLVRLARRNLRSNAMCSTFRGVSFGVFAVDGGF